MKILPFLVFFTQAALNQSLFDLNQKFSMVLGSENRSFELFAVLANLSLPNEVSISVALLNNSLEKCLEIHYFEYSSDWDVELAHSVPVFKDLTWINADMVKSEIPKDQKLAFERFGVVAGRSQVVDVQTSLGNYSKISLKEFTVYFDKKLFKVAQVQGINASFVVTWNAGKVSMVDSEVVYHEILAVFLLAFTLTLSLVRACCKYKK